MKIIHFKVILFFLILFMLRLNAQETYRNNKFTAPSPIQILQKQIDSLLNNPNIENSNWGVIIKSLKKGDFLYKKNANKLFIPASNVKLFTTAGALLLLGPDYHSKTKFFTDGYIDGTILRGNLIVRGSGDPTISGRFFDSDFFKVFDMWVDSLRKKGIYEIIGNIIGDDNLFDDVLLGNEWPWNYESYWYQAPISALSFNENSIEVKIKPSKKYEQALIEVHPNYKNLIIINKVLTISEKEDAEIDIYRNRGTNTIIANGRIPEFSDSLVYHLTINNPTQFFVSSFKDHLENKGLIVDGMALDIDQTEYNDQKNFSLLFEHQSLSLLDMINVVNKTSNNFYAEQILKIIGAEIFNSGTAENGIIAIKGLLEQMGIQSQNYILADGSGISRLNLVTPEQIIELLEFIFKSDQFLNYYESLPIMGFDGTLSDRLKNTKAKGRVRAKTGYLSGVKVLSGYMFSNDNELFTFSILTNNYLAHSSLVDNIQNQICLKIINFSRNKK